MCLCVSALPVVILCPDAVISHSEISLIPHTHTHTFCFQVEIPNPPPTLPIALSWKYACLERTCQFVGTKVKKAELWFRGATDYNKGQEWPRVDLHNVRLRVWLLRVSDGGVEGELGLGRQRERTGEMQVNTTQTQCQEGNIVKVRRDSAGFTHTHTLIRDSCLSICLSPTLLLFHPLLITLPPPPPSSRPFHSIPRCLRLYFVLKQHDPWGGEGDSQHR